jgi:GDP-L-fucose synthase
VTKGIAGKIIVTGAQGFLGRHALDVLRERYGTAEVAGVSRPDYDLTDPPAVRRLLEDHRPAVVVHLAGYVGGIGANRACPADFFHRNLMIMANMFQASSAYGVRKLIYPMGGCSYPAKAVSPIGEEQMWEGFPQPDSAAYSSAKKMGIVASEAYRQQYGLNSVVIVPGNMYGEHDNFRNAESHVVPGLIRRFFEAKEAGAPEVVCWGTGSPTRDFVYAGDVARCLPFFIEQYDTSEPVNLSSGTTTTIRELSETIRELTGYEGRLTWDASKPDGQKFKIFDVKRLNALGLSCDTTLRDGLSRTIEWFAANYPGRGDGLRL